MERVRMRRLKVEKRTNTSAWTVFYISTVAILLAFIVIGFIFLGFGINPLEAYLEIIVETVGNSYGLSQIVWQSIPLLLCGVGLLLAFKTSFWNIGAEGQLLMGATAATWAALFSPVPDPLLIPAAFILGFAGGAVWGLLSTIFRARFSINEVITTLMMNYIASNIVLYLIHGPWKGETMRGFAYTDQFPESAWLPTLGMSNIHWPTLLLGLIAAVCVYLILTRTRLGYEVKVVGQSPKAARYAGISYFRTVFFVMVISGGLAGLAGAGEVLGVHHMLRHSDQISLGYGYTAIIVAWLARGNPLIVILTSLLFGAIYVAGDVLQLSFNLPFQIVNVFTGLILFFLISSDTFLNYKISFKKKEA
jgi:ABC-type uncharacterized transport system permease subunit